MKPKNNYPISKNDKDFIAYIVEQIEAIREFWR